MTRAPARAILLRTATALLAVALVVGLCEAIAYLLPPLSPMDNPWYTCTSPDRDAANPDLPFRRPPHLRWHGTSRGDLAMLNQDRDPYARPLDFATDHEGFRNGTDLTRADILFIGDSFTEAGNVAEDETFAARTARALGLTGRNLGLAGYTPSMELLLLQRYGLPNQPRLVVWQVAEANDLNDAVKYREWLAHGSPLPTREEMPGRLTRAESWRLRSPTFRVASLLRPPRPWTRGVAGTFAAADGRTHPLRFLYVPDPHLSPADHPGFADLAAALATGHQALASNHTALLVCLMPMKFRVFAPDTAFDARSTAGLTRFGLIPPDWQPPPSATLAPHLAAACASNGIAFLDLTPALRAQARAGNLVYLPFDTHLSPAGHAVVADALTARLRELTTPATTTPATTPATPPPPAPPP